MLSHNAQDAISIFGLMGMVLFFILAFSYGGKKK